MPSTTNFKGCFAPGEVWKQSYTKHLNICSYTYLDGMIRVPLIPPRNPLYRVTTSILSSPQDEIYLASWEHTKWLVLSSSFFLFPSMFAFYHHLYFHSFLLCSTSFISANYWRKPTYSWRRTLDLFFSKISFSWFFFHGVFYIHSTPHLIVAVSNTCLFSSCFLLSYYTYQDHRYHIQNTSRFGGYGHDIWYKYHFLFHTLMTLEQYHILYHILLFSVP